MAQNFLSCDREQTLLLPPDLREWLPDDHLAWFVIDAVSELELSAFYADYRDDGWGRAAHDPEMMVALLVYAYALDVRSSRKIERHCREDVAFRVICANQAPDHATIARFRVRHEEQLSALFTQVLGLCAEAGLVSVGTIALDSTKLEANASGRLNRSYRQLAEEILAEADAVDRAEDERYGEARGDELPAELRERGSRIERLRAAKRALEGQHEAEEQSRAEYAARRQERERAAAAEGKKLKGRPPKPRTQAKEPAGRVNVTDPDSRPQRTHRGFIQGYNAQAVTAEGQIVVAAELLTSSADGGQLEPMVDATRAELEGAGVKARPQVALADAGYWSGAQIEALERRGIATLVPPDGQTGGNRRWRAGPYEAMRSKLATERGRKLYRRRQQLVEPVFAQIKVTRGAKRFQRRGLAACRAEWRLITATHNLLKLWRHSQAPVSA
jgi:transposase